MSEIDLLRLIQSMQRDIDILKTRDRAIGQTGAVLRYYLQGTASDIATYKKMLISVFTPKTTLSTAGLAAGNTVLQNFATDPGIPGLSFIPEGEIQFHIHAAKTAGNKTTIIFAQIWEVSAAGVDIGLIATTEASPNIATTETEYTLAAILAAPYVLAGTGSRIVARVTVTVSGGGAAPTIAIYYGVGADSHVEMPSNTIDASNFVPYTGAQADVNLGTRLIASPSIGMTLIADQILGADTATIDFSGIPATYKHLRLEISVRSDKAAVTNDQTSAIRMNNDSGAAQYDSEVSLLENANAPIASINATSALYGIITAATATANNFAVFTLTILDYANTVTNKAFHCEGGLNQTGGSLFAMATFGNWKSTAAINRVTFILGGAAKYKANSRISLFGLK